MVALDFKEIIEKIKKEMSFLSKGISKYELQRTNGSECAAVLLSEVKHPEHYFYLSNGIAIKSLSELLDHLKEMDENTFRQHVNQERNDFSEWVSNIIGDKTLGRKIKELKERDEIAKAVEIRVDFIRRRAQQNY
jgi:hypothetical protein